MTMAAMNSFKNVLDCIQSSGLNYQIQLSPFSAVISLKKTLARNKSGGPLLIPKLSDNTDTTDVKELKTWDFPREDPKRFNDEYEDLLSRYTSATETIDILKKELTDRDISINNLKLSNKVATQSVLIKKEQFDKYQNEVKALKRDIGLLSRQNFELEDKIETFSNKSTQEDILFSQPRVPQPVGYNKSWKEASCTVCYSNLMLYGPNLNYAERQMEGAVCERCFQMSPLDKLSSTQSLEIPSSLVAHWNPLPHDPPYSISASATLRSHCVRLPNPGEIFYTAKDIFDEMKELFKKQESQTDNCKQS